MHDQIMNDAWSNNGKFLITRYVHTTAFFESYVQRNSVFSNGFTHQKNGLPST